MKALVILLVLFPILLCFGLGYMYAADERAFESGAESVKGAVKAVHKQTRFNGRDSEDITTVEVAFTTRDGKAMTEEAEVAYGVGLSAGKEVEVLYKKADPKVIQIRAGFFNRSGKVVFFTLFGVFWLLLGVPILVFLAKAKSAATDPAAKDRIERMKQQLQREQAERENRSR
ncbi:MAG TPA: DUF3592 domain-containing protein [Polyangiaceae bacterium]|nr:DUF3592 domain-containing protein [Polyangiaceae bacterium]